MSQLTVTQTGVPSSQAGQQKHGHREVRNSASRSPSRRSGMPVRGTRWQARRDMPPHLPHSARRDAHTGTTVVGAARLARRMEGCAAHTEVVRFGETASLWGGLTCCSLRGSTSVCPTPSLYAVQVRRSAGKDEHGISTTKSQRGSRG